MADVSLPNEWRPRPYQQPVFQHMMMGGLERKRGVLVWHRRAGKDSFCLNLSAVASQMRVGTIWHMLPTLKQGRKVIWEGIDKHGRRMIDQAFPIDMRAGKNDQEMQIKLKNGSIYQVVGSDNYDSLVGTNPVGVIMSEYSIADPAAWDYIRPILAENDGWAVFIYTPRGKNHGRELWEIAERINNPKWFSSLLTVDDTNDWDGRHIILPEHIEDERAAGMSEERIQQEFYCSWNSGMEGAFYTTELNLAETENRIGDFPHDPNKLCTTYWDIGYRDQTCILISQRGDDGKPIIVDMIVDRNKPLDFYVRQLKEKGYTYEEHWGPHDFDNTDWVTGKTRVEIARNLGINVGIIEKLPLADGIDATRAMIRVARFNKPKVQRLLDGLAGYRREYDDKTKRFRDTPVHDWASDIADSMRYLSVGWRDYSVTNSAAGRRVKAMYSVKRAVGRR